MAFSQRFGAAAQAKAQAPAPARPPAAEAADDKDDEVEGAGQQRGREDEAERRRVREQEEAARRRTAAFEARRKAEEEERRRREYEAEKVRQETIARSKREAAKRAMGPSGGGDMGAFGARSSGGFGGGQGGGTFAWKKSTAAGKGTAKGGAAADPRHRADLPSHDDCEMGISAMISRTQNGMKEGLSHLGLPHFPLLFVPGQELTLCGHNLREEVNEMIHAWMTDEKDYFYECLEAVHKICSKPLLTEEDMEYVDQKGEWVKTKSADGRTLYKMRDDNDPAPQRPDDDDDDDEVIDVTPAGARLPPSGAAGADRPALSKPAVPASAAGALAGAGSAGPAAADEDFYELLGVEPSASLQEIRSKFRALVVTEHPEKGGDIKKFQMLNKAYSVLSDQKRRQDFDAQRAGAGAAAGAGYPAGAAHFVD